jgi:hypothetical protein
MSKCEFNVAYPREAIDTKGIDAKIPGSELTVQTAAQFLSSLLGLPNRQMTGEVTQNESKFQLRLRYGQREITTDPTEQISELVTSGSETAMRLANPYVLAAKL